MNEKMSKRRIQIIDFQIDEIEHYFITILLQRFTDEKVEKENKMMKEREIQRPFLSFLFLFSREMSEVVFKKQRFLQHFPLKKALKVTIQYSYFILF